MSVRTLTPLNMTLLPFYLLFIYFTPRQQPALSLLFPFHSPTPFCPLHPLLLRNRSERSRPPWPSAKHGLSSYHKIKNLPLQSGWAKQSNMRNRFLKASQRTVSAPIIRSPTFRPSYTTIIIFKRLRLILCRLPGF